MNIRLEQGSFFSSILGSGSKSAQQQLQRQQKCENEVNYWEERKESLKGVSFDTLEEIAEKLDTLQSYQDQIAAVKTAYNNEQMWHVLDEAKEIGEKIAEEAEKLEPKTAEERKEEQAENVQGTEENEGMLSEAVEEISEMAEESLEQTQGEEMTREISDAIKEAEEAEEEKKDLTETIEEDIAEVLQEDVIRKASLKKTDGYKRVDIRI